MAKRRRTNEALPSKAVDSFNRPLDGEAVPYLQQTGLAYEPTTTNKRGTLIDIHGFAVMMEWERGLMAAHAEYAVGDGQGRILNVGHGMGIVDEEIQRRIGHQGTHTIIEVRTRSRKRVASTAKFSIAAAAAGNENRGLTALLDVIDWH